jgi:rare lipoprotein A
MRPVRVELALELDSGDEGLLRRRRRASSCHVRSGWGIAALAAGVALGIACESPPPYEPGIRGFNSYRVKGVTYTRLRSWQGYQEIGEASWYGGRFHGRLTASGERFDTHRGFTAAHKTLPFGVCAAVRNLRNDRSVTVRINDRGPFVEGRVIDLSQAAAAEIGLLDDGVAPVRVHAVGAADARGRCDG